MFLSKMSTRLLAAMVLALIFSQASSLAAPMSINQLLDLTRVSKADISPDGKLAAFTAVQNRSLDDAAGSSWSRLYVISTKEGAPKPYLTGEVSVSNPSFSPDGKFIAFRMTRGPDAKSQVWAMPVDGGEAVAVTKSETGVSVFAWSSDGLYLFTIEAEAQNEDEKKLAEKGWLPRWYEENMRGRYLCRTPFKWNSSAQESEILVDDAVVWKLAVDPTGAVVVFSSSEQNLVDDSIMFQNLHVLDLASGETRLLVDVPGKLGDVKVSPDGRNVAWTGGATLNDHAVSTVFVTAMDGHETRNLTVPNYQGHARHLNWRDKRTVLVQVDEGAHTKLIEQRIDRDTGNSKVVFDGQEQGLVVGLPASRPGLKTMVMTGHHQSHPTELYLWKGKGEAKRLTYHNSVLDEVELAEQKVITWEARDGLQIEGILQMPVNWDGKQFPLIVDVHGGPESNHHHGWVSRYVSPGHVFCGMGFGVLYPNYRGSTGRGLDFAASSFGDPAGAEFDDIVDGVDYLINQGLVDGQRVGVMGGSYGGYATNWLTTRYSARFVAGVSFVGVSDLVSKRFLTDIPYEDLYVHMGKPVRETWELMLERSPILYADQSKTPLLILHGDSDPRVHPSQSQEIYRALKMAGHPAVRLVWYPGEGHGNSKRFGRVDYVHRTLAWFKWYMLDGHPWDGEMPALDLSDEMGLPFEDDE